MSRRAARRIAVFIAAFVLPVLAIVAVHVHQPPDLHQTRPIAHVVDAQPSGMPIVSLEAALDQQQAEEAYLQAEADQAQVRVYLESAAAAAAAAKAKAAAAAARAKPSVPRSYVAAATESRGHNWDAVAACESGGDWAINTGNGFSGGLQFMLGTWRNNGGPTDYPWQATRDQQITVAETILSRSTWQTQWPVCGRYL